MLENTAPLAAENYSLFDVLARGGWVMIPLAICSMFTIAIVIERLISGPRRSRVLPPGLWTEIKSLLANRKFEEVVGICRANNSPLSRMVLAILRSGGKSREQLIDAAQAAGKKEVLLLQRYTSALSTIAAVSPLLGLLGTVSGMIKTFGVIQQMGVGQPQVLAGGISESLVATASGLAVAIPALLAQRYFATSAKVLIPDLEQVALEVVDLLPTTNAAPQDVVQRIPRTVGP